MHVWFAYMHSNTVRLHDSHTQSLKCVICVRFVLCIRTQTWSACLSTLSKREHTQYRALKKKEFACDRKRNRQTICSCIFETHTHRNGICLRKCLYFESMQDIERVSIQIILQNVSLLMNSSAQFSAKSIALHCLSQLHGANKNACLTTERNYIGNILPVRERKGNNYSRRSTFNECVTCSRKLRQTERRRFNKFSFNKIANYQLQCIFLMVVTSRISA